MMPQELQAARLRLVKSHPYLAAAAWALHPVEKPGLGTLAVDQWWRLYYDPAVAALWTVEELAGVLYHEISHMLRDHAGRMKEFERAAANIAADAEINDDLIAEGIRLPANPVTPEKIGQPDGLLAEEYYAALQEQQSAPDQGASAQPSGADHQGAKGDQQGDEQATHDGETAPQEKGASSADHGDENRSDSSTNGQGGGHADDAQPGDRGDGSGSKPGDPDGSEPGGAGSGETGDPAGSKHPASSGQPSGASGQPESSSQPPASPGSGHGSGQDGRESGDQAQTPAPGAGRCGSCATGQREPWEEGPPDSSSPGTSRAEGEMIRRDVARQIVEHSRTRGDVPGHWSRWAEEKLRPKVNWRRELATAIRHAVADVAGAVDYSYRKPSRRQGQIGNGKVVMPSLRHPIPSVAVVVDTSGSMSDAMLSQALAEVSGILKGMGQREGVHVVACDAQVHTCKKVFTPRQIQLAGGGGTDMGEGIEAAIKLRPRPQVIVVLTDGFTPWPDTAPKKTKVIVALTSDGDTPGWAKTVKVGEE